MTSSSSSTPRDFAARKVIRSRPRTRWTTDLDEIEFAHTSLHFESRGAVVRDGSSDVRSIANVQKLSMLQEIFPSIPVELMEDVLITAQFRTDTAASMMSELSRELAGGNGAAEQMEEVEFVDWASLHTERDAEYWHEVSESRPELQQWVMVQDDWEVIDPHVIQKENVRSYAEVLRSNAGSGEINLTRSLPQLSPVIPAFSMSPLMSQKNKETSDMPEDEGYVGSKSFGTRKRRFLRKFRA